MLAKLKSFGLTSTMLALLLSLSSCQFQPLYSSSDGSIGAGNVALSRLYVKEVTTREAQQVRNHLIFLLSGGSSPITSTHDIKLRVTASTRTLAAAARSNNDTGTNQIGNTAGSVVVRASYEVFDKAKKEIIFRGTREASAAYDKTSQSFATERAERDATNRAAKSAAEMVRLAIASDFNSI